MVVNAGLAGTISGKNEGVRRPCPGAGTSSSPAAGCHDRKRQQAARSPKRFARLLPAQPQNGLSS